MLFHHDPLHTDADLEAMLLDARAVPGAAALDLELGYEGQTLALA